MDMASYTLTSFDSNSDTLPSYTWRKRLQFCRTGLLIGLTVMTVPAAHARQKTSPISTPPRVSNTIPTGTNTKSLPSVDATRITPAAKSEPVELRMKFKPGDINKYQMTMQANILIPGQAAGASNPYDTHISLIVQQNTVKVNADGSADIAIATQTGTGVVNGKQYKPAINEKPSVLTFDTRNNIVATKNLPKSAGSADLTGQIFQSGALSTQGVYLPQHAVRIGDTWTQKANIASLGKGSSGTVKTTFLRMEPVGLFNTARLRSVMKIPFTIVNGSSKLKAALSGMLTMTYDSNLAVREGKIVRSTGDGDITVIVVMPDMPSANTTNSDGGKKPALRPAGNPSTQSQKVTVKLQQGNNLITQ